MAKLSCKSMYIYIVRENADRVWNPKTMTISGVFFVKAKFRLRVSQIGEVDLMNDGYEFEFSHT